jgi:autotransporter-associated beta strand protein
MLTKNINSFTNRICSFFVFALILSIFNGSELFSQTTWLGTNGVATSASNWNNGLPSTNNGAILNGTGGTVSSALNFENTAFSVTNLAVSNYSGDVTLNNLTDFRLGATTASLVANGVAGSTLTINNSATSTASTVAGTANVWSGNMNIFLNRFVTHGTGARTLTTSIGQLTINDFNIQATSTGGTQSINNTGTININTLSQRSGSTLVTPYMTTFAGGTVNLLGANNSTVYSGIRLNGSTTLNLAGNGSLGTADLVLNGGTSTYNLGLTSGSSSAVTLANNLIITSGTANTVLNIVPGSGKSLALNGLISSPSASGGLVSFGAGTISIAGTNSYNTKTQIVDGGKLEVAKFSTTDGSSLGTAGEATAANLTLDNGTLSYVGSEATNARNFTIGAGGARIEANGTGLLKMGSTGTIATSGSGNRSLTLAGANTATNSFSLKVADGTGGITTVVKNGTGVWNIAGIGSTYTGGTEVRGGTLIAGSGDTSGFGTGEIRLYNGTTFKASGTTTRVFTNTFRAEGEINMDWVQAQSAVNLASDTKITANGTNSSGSSTVTFNGAIGGTGGLTKSGLGSMTLSATNVYTGATSLKQGSLLVASNASIASSSGTTVDGGILNVNGTAGGVTVNTGGSLGGSGTVGALTLNSGSLLNPGNSPGTLTAAAATVLGGSIYNWQITSLTGTAGTNWDLLSVSGLLDMSGVTSSSKWNLVVTGDSGFTGWTGTNEYSYVFAQATSVAGFSSVAGTDVTSLFNITTAGIANLPNSSSTPSGDFKVTVGSVGGLTTLNLMTVPEPSAASLMGIGLGALMILRTIRRRQS